MDVPKFFVERFNKKWRLDPSGCWLWTASVRGGGYGQIKLPRQRRQIYAHRLSYLIHRGEIPDGLEVCHTCDNPGCVNPEHLFVGTSKDNHQDMKAKGRHLFGELNSSSKMTEEDARWVLKLLRQGLPQTEIAAVVGISQIQVSRIKRGLRWAHINPHPMPAEPRRKALTDAEIRQIRAMLNSGVEGTKIAKILNCSTVTISRIKLGKRWAHIT